MIINPMPNIRTRAAMIEMTVQSPSASNPQYRRKLSEKPKVTAIAASTPCRYPVGTFSRAADAVDGAGSSVFVGALIGTSLNYYEAKDGIIALRRERGNPKECRACPVAARSPDCGRIEHKLMIVATSAGPPPSPARGRAWRTPGLNHLASSHHGSSPGTPGRCRGRAEPMAARATRWSYDAPARGAARPPSPHSASGPRRSRPPARGSTPPTSAPWRRRR